AVERQAFSQQAAARGFEHRRVDVRVHQHIARAARAAAVAAVDAAAFDVDAVGVGHAGAQAARRQQVGDQPHRGGLAVGAGHGNHRNPAIIAGGEHGRDNRFAHRAAFAERWRQVHAQAGGGVYFDDAAVLFFDWFEYAVAYQVD